MLKLENVIKRKEKKESYRDRPIQIDRENFVYQWDINFRFNMVYYDDERFCTMID